MKPEEIRQMTDDVEIGNGCKVAEKLLEIPFSERQELFNQILKLNRDDRAADASLPVLGLSAAPFLGDNWTYITRNLPESSKFSQEMIVDIAQNPEAKSLPKISGIANESDFKLETKGEFGQYKVSCHSDMRK